MASACWHATLHTGSRFRALLRGCSTTRQLQLMSIDSHSPAGRAGMHTGAARPLLRWWAAVPPSSSPAGHKRRLYTAVKGPRHSLCNRNDPAKHPQPSFSPCRCLSPRFPRHPPALVLPHQVVRGFAALHALQQTTPPSTDPFRASASACGLVLPKHRVRTGDHMMLVLRPQP